MNDKTVRLREDMRMQLVTMLSSQSTWARGNWLQYPGRRSPERDQGILSVILELCQACVWLRICGGSLSIHQDPVNEVGHTSVLVCSCSEEHDAVTTLTQQRGQRIKMKI